MALHSRIALTLWAMLGSPIVVPAQPACTQTALPAYSHNDYERQHPLLDALAHGYRGVEVDIFHVDGVLRVGHDRRTARGDPSRRCTSRRWSSGSSAAGD